MSNTGVVTPYRSISVGLSDCLTAVAAPFVGAAAGISSAVRWLSEETLEDQTAVGRFRKERRQERLGCLRSELRPITTVDLHLRDPERFVRSAEKLGYRLEPLSQPFRPLKEQPRILLRGASGERMVVGRNAKGRVVVQTAGEASRVQAVVRHHTVDQAIQHLAGAGMNVKTAVLCNGEVQILACEQAAGQPDGHAEIKAQVRVDGTAWVDVEKVRGPRCKEIVSQFAEAIGGEISGMKFKDSFFQLPGEPTKTHLKV